MVQTIIKMGEHQDRILNVIKGKYGFKNKSDAINFIINQYEKEFLEPQLRPEYLEKLNKISNKKHISKEEFEKLLK